VETDALDYAFTAILFIVNEENEVYSVAFHSHTFTMAELNYDMHDKKLLAIFEGFKIWQHYLEGPVYPINVVIDHKNLEYFSTTKVLTGSKHGGPSTFLSSTLSLGAVLAILAQNRTLSLDSGMSILKGEYWLHHSQPSQLQAYLHSRTTCGLCTSYCPPFPFSLHSYSCGSGHPTLRHPFSSS